MKIKCPHCGSTDYDIDEIQGSIAEEEIREECQCCECYKSFDIVVKTINPIVKKI